MADDPGSGPVDSAALAQHPLTAPRLAKVQAMRKEGRDPYPVRYERGAYAGDLSKTYGDLAPGESTGTVVSVAGRIMGMRSMGRLTFAVLQDWSGRIQLFADESTLGKRYAEFSDLDLGDWVGAGGEVVTTQRGELSVKVAEFSLLAKSLRPFPDKWHGLQDREQRHRKRYLDLAVNEEAREILKLRSGLVSALRRAFRDRGFVEVETPMLQAQPGGALARPFETFHHALGLPMYLRIAPELYLKRLVIGGVERVFELNRSFRNEGVSPRRNPEFTMLEAYQAFADYFDVMALVEEVIVEAANRLLDSTTLRYQGRELDLTPPWRRVEFVEVIAEVTGAHFSLGMTLDEARKAAGALGLDIQGTWGIGKIMTEVFDKRVESKLWDPTIVMDYPKEVSPLARTHRDDPNLAERFEVIVAGQEIVNAFSELNDPAEQRLRFEAQAAARAEGDEEAHPVDEDYLQALEYGLPPCGGLGIGVDRLAMIFADVASIREVILFPHLRPE